MKNLLSARMPVSSLLRIRPTAIASLEGRNIGFWNLLDQPLGHLFRQSGGLEDFLDEVGSAPIPSVDSDWAALPLYSLVDRLTQEHRDFLLQDLTDIAHLLDIHTLSYTDEMAALGKIHGRFQDLVKDIHLHLDEEEGFLFPKILRYEASLRDPRVHPEFHRGSVHAYAAIHASVNEDRIVRITAELAEKAKRAVREYPSSFAMGELAELLERLEEKLRAHADLELSVLLPMARELEKNLYNLAIGGDPLVAYRRESPLDSGILRLKEA